MEYKLKSIFSNGIGEAISKAERYRLLNEPEEAESICRDILAIEPEHQMALRVLGLAITDEFTGGPADRYREAEEAFEKLADPYEKHYYMGVLLERLAKTQLRAGRSPHTVLALFEEALHRFAEAEKIRPKGNDDAILRWNRCVRLLESRPASEWHREPAPLDAGDSPPF